MNFNLDICILKSRNISPPNIYFVLKKHVFEETFKIKSLQGKTLTVPLSVNIIKKMKTRWLKNMFVLPHHPLGIRKLLLGRKL